LIAGNALLLYVKEKRGVGCKTGKAASTTTNPRGGIS
jgi:hypothetical protein